MFDKWRSTSSDRPPAQDERLSALLRGQKGIEPSAGFEAAVWRRIRVAGALEQGTFRWSDLLADWALPRAAWATALAASLAILIGVWAGFSTSAGRLAAEPLLHAHTLAGSYLAMANGETR